MAMKVMTDEEKQVVTMVRDFVKRDIEPVASEMEHADAYPFEIVEKMRGLGLFGCTIGEQYGGMGLNSYTYAKVIEEITAGWMSIAGVINSHLIMAHVLELFGTEDQKEHFLPKMATAEFRGGIALTEPNCGSDVAAIQTSAVRDGDDYVVNGTKMLITNGEQGETFAVLAKTDKETKPAYKGIGCFIMQKGPGFTHGRHLEKLGYRGIDTTELIFDDFHVPSSNLIGEEEGQGFKQMMTGLELGRINVAARGVGVARAAFEKAMAYAQQRHTFGVPIAQHQAIQIKLADMYTKIEASRLLVEQAAAKKDAGERCDLEAGAAKLFASETAMEVALEAMRVHGGVGYTKEHDVERYFRDAPLMIIGEGTNEIQRTVMARQLLQRFKHLA